LPLCFFVSDLHGRVDRYAKLFDRISSECPAALFLGGDILPSGVAALFRGSRFNGDFLNDFMIPEFVKLRQTMGNNYPRVFLIMGNDDLRSEEPLIIKAASLGIWEYMHQQWTDFDRYKIGGYSYVPPSPFLLKDWERYDISRYVDPGSVSPEEGHRTVPVPESEIIYSTIAGDLEKLTGQNSLDTTVLLFHAPPYKTNLDRAALDGKKIDHVPLDVHVGSIAVRKFIESRQPLLTLHGHIHESARLTGSWQDRIEKTICLSAAHDGPELALVRVDLDHPAEAVRELI